MTARGWRDGSRRPPQWLGSTNEQNDYGFVLVPARIRVSRASHSVRWTWEDRMTDWERPVFVEIKMDAEIGSYQEDSQEPEPTPFCGDDAISDGD
jgi:hypothetical protein